LYIIYFVFVKTPKYKYSHYIQTSLTCPDVWFENVINDIAQNETNTCSN